jgi:hypothetical protein
MSLGHSPRIVTNGLVLLLDPANTRSYPGTGTTWFDLSGYSNHATLSGSPVFLTNQIVFDGVDDQATIPSSQSSLDFSREQTVIIWMYHTYTSGRKNPWNQAYGGYGTWTHEDGININYFYGTAGTDNVPYTALTSGSTPTGQWQCMAVVRSLASVTWYRNGTLMTIQANPYGLTGITSSNITIGNGYAGRWIGSMGTISAYTRALTEAEVRQNFNALRGRYGI